MGKLIDIKTKQQVEDIYLSDEEFAAYVAYMKKAITILKNL